MNGVEFLSWQPEVVIVALSLPCSPTWSLHSVHDPIQGPLLPLKMGGGTYLAFCLLLSNSTQHSKQYKPSECPGLYIGLEVLTSSLNGNGQVELWFILRVNFPLVLVSKPIFFKNLCHRTKKLQ